MKVCLAACAFWVSLALGAVSADVSGTVINAATGQPIPGALVTRRYFPVSALGGSTPVIPVIERRITDANGHFSFPEAAGAGTQLDAARAGSGCEPHHSGPAR